MAAYTGTGLGAYKGNNNAYPLIVNHKLAQALVATDTIDVTIPADYKDAVPCALEVWGPESSGVRTRNANLSITTHNEDTGVTRFTASGNVPIGAVLVVSYHPALA